MEVPLWLAHVRLTYLQWQLLLQTHDPLPHITGFSNIPLDALSFPNSTYPSAAEIVVFCPGYYFGSESSYLPFLTVPFIAGTSLIPSLNNALLTERSPVSKSTLLGLIVIPTRIFPCRSIAMAKINISIADDTGPRESKAPLINKAGKDNHAASLFTPGE